jgi:hypothetical protein
MGQVKRDRKMMAYRFRNARTGLPARTAVHDHKCRTARTGLQCKTAKTGLPGHNFRDISARAVFAMI